jgi:hypothetical protein
VKSKVKVLAVTLATIAVASVLLYAPLTNAHQFGEEQSPETRFVKCYKCKPRLRAHLIRWFLRRSEPVEVEGTVVALFKRLLIVNTDEGQIRIHLSQAWIIDEELTMREELFESGYLSKGENIVVKALRADVIAKEGLRIYLLLGYEIIDESGVHAYAVLPFNIET